MKKVYFYDKQSGEYVGMTNSGQACPAGCIASDKLQESSLKSEQPLPEKKESKAGDYADLVALYTDRQIHGAMIRAKGYKLEALTAEKAKREQ